MDCPSARALADLARAYVLRRHGEMAIPVRVVIHFGAGLDFERLSVELASVPPPPATAAPTISATMEANILEALGLADKPLTGEQLATKAGYAFNGRFRSCLAAMVRVGSLQNHHPGYSLPG